MAYLTNIFENLIFDTMSQSKLSELLLKFFYDNLESPNQSRKH